MIVNPKYTAKMRESIKKILKRFKGPDARCLVETNDKRELSAADFNKVDLTSGDFRAEYDVESEVVEEFCPHRPNIATCLITLFLMIVFCVLPVVYLFHCFGLLNGNWTTNKKYDHFESHNIFMSERHTSINHIKESLSKTYKPNISKHLSPKVSLPSPKIVSPEMCLNVPDTLKFDCFPEDKANESTCNARGCCWSSKSNKLTDVPLDTPYCFYPENYKVYEWINISDTGFGASAFMRRTFKSPYPNDIDNIRIDAKYETENRIRIKIYDPSHTRFEPPYPEVPIVDRVAPNINYRFVIDGNKTGFKVVRKCDNQSLFDSQNVGGLIFADQFLQISSLLASNYVYGLGEHRSTFLLSTHWQKFIMWNHDAVPKENTNLYGSHPFYMVLEKSGLSHGVFLLNSNALEIIIQPTPAITFRAIGGILDFYVFLGPTPTEVAQQYNEIIGKPYFPPYWSLGFHLCRFGYKSLNNTREVWKRTRDFGIPLDVQWNDLDYMNNSNDFTYDKINFEGLPKFVDELHDLGMKYTVLIDPGVSSAEKVGTYPPYDEGVKLGIFVKNMTGKPFEGKVWNGVSTVWPDFTHPSTVDYWMHQLTNLHNEFSFDGAWIDMNEPSNFYSGTKHGCPNNSLEHPSYVPAVDGGVLYYKTLCMSSNQYAGSHYDVHNLYGFTEAIVTSFAMAEIRSKRPFVISRATFPGHGHFAGHWTGDIESSWYDMRRTIPQILNLNMFGIPLVGADICGFNGNTTAPLCNRWSQLGAFYPFSRNHNTDDGIDQDPVALGKDVAVSAKNALLIRYSLLPYLYTLFYEAHTQGTLVARPLLFEFPQDPQTYVIDDQFLWGSALMIVPVLDPDHTEVSAYLPNALWYDFYSFAEVTKSGQQQSLEAPLHRIPLLLRGGFIIPMQEPNVTTVETRNNPFELLAMPDENGKATGFLFWDDGDTLNTIADRQYNLLNFTLNGSELNGSASWWGYDESMILGKVTILGVKTPVKTVYVNKAAMPFSYDTINKFLQLESLQVPLKDVFNMRWI